MSLRKHLLLLGLFALAVTACDNAHESAQTAPEMPRFDNPDLVTGRSVWMGTCRNCHLLGVAGAPAVTDFPSWKPRIAKGTLQLYASTLNGVQNAQGVFVKPPRGGNTRLSEQQVRQAVDYMIAAVEYLHAAP